MRTIKYKIQTILLKRICHKILWIQIDGQTFHKITDQVKHHMSDLSWNQSYDRVRHRISDKIKSGAFKQ